MPGEARSADYLALHRNISRRVSNLETGVHPTLADTSHFDTYQPSPITITNTSLAQAEAGIQDYPPVWQRRVGIVSLLGGVEPKPTDPWSTLAAEEPVGTLPAAARPLAGDLVFVVPAQNTPFYTTIRVTTSGGIYVTKPAGATGTDWVRFEGATWTAD